MRTTIFLLLLIIAQSLAAQGVLPADWGLRAFHIKDSQLGDIHFYITEKGMDQDKPILFIVSGVRGLPIMMVVQAGEKSTQLGTIPPDQISAFSDQYHVAFISKAGTPFCDTLITSEINPMQNFEDYQPSREYIEKCGMEWEIQASSLVLDTLCQMLPNSQEKVITMGLSAGGRLAVGLAATSSRVTHLVSVISGGLNQFYSSIINRRLDAAAGAISHHEAQAAIDSLFSVYREIYRDPESTDRYYYGHPYKRWGSFCSDIPLEHLVKLDIPILYVAGTADRSSPALQVDYVILEFIRLGKTNLTAHMMAGCDHSLYEAVMEDGTLKHISRRKEAFQSISHWIESN